MFLSKISKYDALLSPIPLSEYREFAKITNDKNKKQKSPTQTLLNTWKKMGCV